MVLPAIVPEIALVVVNVSDLIVSSNVVAMKIVAFAIGLTVAAIFPVILQAVLIASNVVVDSCDAVVIMV